MVNQLTAALERLNVYDIFQSGIWQTALLRVSNDIMFPAAGECSLLVAVDLSLRLTQQTIVLYKEPS